MSSLQFTAADINKLAEEAYEDIFGYEPGSGLKDGHKPVRQDIQKMKDAVREHDAGKALQEYEKLGPTLKEKTDPEALAKLEHEHEEWERKTALNVYEKAALELYRHTLSSPNDVTRGLRDQEAKDAAFNWVAGSVPPGTDPQDPKAGAKLLGTAIKKYEYSQTPKLYYGIHDTVSDLQRRNSTTYKMFPWAVREMKRIWNNSIWDSNWKPEGPGTRWPPNFSNDRLHLVDIAGEAGEVLHELRENHQMPANFDVQQLDHKQLEDWLMTYKREHGLGDDGGKTVHEFGDGWTVKKLHTPQQLTWEGDQMDHCQPAGQMVTGYDMKPIESLAVGDQLAGEDGRPHRVYKLLKRQYKGEMIEITTRATLPIMATAKHQFLVLRPESTGSPWQDRYLHRRIPETLTPNWMHAIEVEVGDYLLSPKLQWDLEVESPLQPDRELAWLFGEHIGDGHSGHGRVEIALAINDDWQRVVSALKLLSTNPVSVNETPTYRKVRTNSTTLSNQFKEWFGEGGLTKQIPDFIFNGEWDVEALLEGLLAADGCYIEDEDRWVFTSISPKLAWQVWHIVVSLGYRPTIKTNKRKEGHGYPNAKPSWKVEWRQSQGAWHSNVFWNDYYITPVTKISNVPFEGMVYDFNVEDHSYLAHGVISHQCVGGYWAPVREGNSHIYSFRDQDNKPHATLEFTSPHFEDSRDLYKKVEKRTPNTEVTEGPFFKSEDQMSGSGEKPEGTGLFEYVKHVPFEDSGEQLYHKGAWGFFPVDHPKVVQLNQHMGPHDQTPNSNANTHIKDWFDHHRDNGWEINRARNFFYPNNWNHEGDEYGEEIEHLPFELGHYDGNRYDRTATKLDNWYDDHFKANPALWLRVADEKAPTDMYGLPVEHEDGEGLMNVNWENADQSIQRALADEYDTDVDHHRYPYDLARAYWVAHHVDTPVEGTDAFNRHKKWWENHIQSMQDSLDRNAEDAWHYNREHHIDDIRDAYEKAGGKFADDDETALDPDAWYEAEDQARYKQEEDLYGNNYKFMNYLYHLNHKHGPMTPQELYDHHMNGTFPKPGEVIPPDPEPTGTEDMPGTFSHWVEAAEEEWQPFGQQKQPGRVRQWFDQRKNNAYSFIWHPPSDTFDMFPSGFKTHRKRWQELSIPAAFDRRYCGYAHVNGQQASVHPYRLPNEPVNAELEGGMRDRVWPELYARHPYLQNGPQSAQEALSRHGSLRLVSSIMDAASEAMEALTNLGGFSLSEGLVPADGKGYFTSVAGYERQIPITDLSAALILAFREEHLPFLQSDPMLMIGGWLHKGMAFLDLSKRFDDKDECMAFARENGQLAIWDGYEQKEILLSDAKVAVSMSPWADQFKHIIVVGDDEDPNPIQAFGASRISGEVIPFGPPANSVWERKPTKDYATVVKVEQGNVYYTTEPNPITGAIYETPLPVWMEWARKGFWVRVPS